MIQWPETLLREIADRRVVFFIGSGISKAANPTFPGWAQLLQSLAASLETRKDRELVKRLIRQGRLLDAAQVIRDGRVRADLSAELRRIFQVRPIPHHSVYEDILTMDPKTIITTNYDELIEKNFEHYSDGGEAHSISTHKDMKILNDLRSPIRSILKMHGCISDPDTVVLDRVSYFNARWKNPAFFDVVSALLTVNTVLFIGYSISDPDIQLILENANLYGGESSPHYALMPKFDHRAIRDANARTYNLHFLEYPPNQHEQVPELLSDLRQRVVEVRAERGIV